MIFIPYNATKKCACAPLPLLHHVQYFPCMQPPAASRHYYLDTRVAHDDCCVLSGSLVWRGYIFLRKSNKRRKWEREIESEGERERRMLWVGIRDDAQNKSTPVHIPTHTLPCCSGEKQVKAFLFSLTPFFPSTRSTETGENNNIWQKRRELYRQHSYNIIMYVYRFKLRFICKKSIQAWAFLFPLIFCLCMYTNFQPFLSQFPFPHIELYSVNFLSLDNFLVKYIILSLSCSYKE